MATKFGKTVAWNFSSSQSPTKATSILSSTAAARFSRVTLPILNESPAASKILQKFPLNLGAGSEFAPHLPRSPRRRFPSRSIGLCNFIFRFRCWSRSLVPLEKSMSRNVAETFSSALKKIRIPTGLRGRRWMNLIFIGRAALGRFNLKNKSDEFEIPRWSRPKNNHPASRR